MGGFSVKPNEDLQLGLDVTWNNAQAGLDPFRMPEAEAWSAAKPNQNHDFSQTHTYSDLDTTRVDTDLYMRYFFKPGKWVQAGYRYVDYQDDAPFLYDTSGSVDYYTISLGWKK